jgi:tetratricopeptide (TPR) repeat protein
MSRRRAKRPSDKRGAPGRWDERDAPGRSDERGAPRRSGERDRRQHTARTRGVMEHAPDPAPRRAALALWAALVLTVLARAVLTFVPNMIGWSLNLQRFLAPWWAWAPWTLAALALVPPLARRVEPAFRRAGEAIARGSWVASLVAAASAALLVSALPDQLWFVGDFQLRQGAIVDGSSMALFFPQAMPLDLFLHVDLPVQLMGAGRPDLNWAPRALGAFEAALLALLALAFARALALRGTGALMVAVAVFFGGYLGLYTGYSKVSGELVLVAVAVATFGLRAACEPSATGSRRALLWLGVTLALGAFLHRSAVGFVPAALLAFVLALAARPAALRNPETWVAVGLPVLAFALTFGRIVRTFTQIDLGAHLASPEVTAQGGLLGSMFAGTRAVDLPNVVVLLAPLAPILPLVALAWGRRLPRGREAAVLITLAVPFLGLLLYVHPAQGVFRDYDTLSGAGITIALLAAWFAGETLRRTPSFAWAGVAVALAAAAPSVQWVVHQADVDRGLARVAALMTEPPARGPEERGETWDYVGVRNFNRDRWEESAQAYARAAETQPSARVLAKWAMAETMRGDLRAAQRIYRRAIARDSSVVIAWQGYGVVSLRLGEWDEARRAALVLRQRDPDNPEGPAILKEIERARGARQRSGAGR